MTILSRRRSFDYLPRPKLEAKVRHLEEQRDRALAARRAQRDQIAAWLTSRAGGYREDADHLDRLAGQLGGPHGPETPLTAAQRRAVAAELEQLAYDFEEQTC